ncbi:fimbrial protein [Siccibacter colletis]|uniref:fimbrial protein n=1 Tax=Siccibacter colletis TaxID=1505757 RepID=UPI003CF16F1B
MRNIYRVAHFFIAQLIFITLCCQHASANISGAHGLAYSKGQLICNGGSYTVDTGSKFKAGVCTLNFNDTVYAPHAGMYRVKVMSTGAQDDYVLSNPVAIDPGVPINAQNLVVSGTDKNIHSTTENVYVHYCYALVDEAGKAYGWEGSGTRCGVEPEPLPPTPPEPPSSCIINNANSLNVSLGTLERSTLPTIPGSGTIKQISIPVQCSGTGSVNMSMKLNYTPITVSGKQVVKTSANGLGVAVIYRDQPLSNASATSVTFTSGSNTLSLGFEAVRDPTVSSGTIPAGAFTASAVLVMTQQ